MGRVLLAFVMLGVVAAGFSGCSGKSDDQTSIVVDERAGLVAGVGFGATAQEIRRRLGEPSDDKPGFFPAGEAFTGPPSIAAPASDQGRPPHKPTPLHYNDVAFLVSPGAGVFSMATLADGARTRAGVAIGEGLDKVRDRYEQVTCGEQVAGESLLGGKPPKYDWCRTVVAGVRVFFGGNPIESITLTRYSPSR